MGTSNRSDGMVQCISSVSFLVHSYSDEVFGKAPTKQAVPLQILCSHARPDFTLHFFE